MAVAPPGRSFADLAHWYRRHLIDDVMGFWTVRTGDPEYSGYLVPFDRQGILTSTDKNNWCQGRQTWMFAALYNEIEQRSEWLALARHGRDFLIDHAYAGEGRWYYLHDREGNVKISELSWLTDAFAIIGLAEYARASGDQQDLDLIRSAFGTLERNLKTPGFDQFYHHPLDPTYVWHGPQMIALSTAQALRPLLGSEAVAEMARYALDRILNVFAKDKRRMIFEMLHPDQSIVESDTGLRVNPGHAIESSWFCMEEALHLQNRELFERAARFCGYAYEKGWDQEHGGILAFTDPEGNPPPGVIDVVNDWGERWDDKVWWVHSEALYATALAGIVLQDQGFMDRFSELDEFCRRYFWDQEYGEWYCYLNRDNTPRISDKGTWIKAAFHIPRNLLKLTQLFDRAATGQAPTLPLV